MAEIKKEFQVKGEDLIKKVKKLLHEGNIRRIIVKNEKGEVYLEVPLNIGVVGTILAPVWAALGALAAIAVSFRIEVIKKEPVKKTQKAKKATKSTKRKKTTKKK